jgi:hypothetical protein
MLLRSSDAPGASLHTATSSRDCALLPSCLIEPISYPVIAFHTVHDRRTAFSLFDACRAAWSGTINAALGAGNFGSVSLDPPSPSSQPKKVLPAIYIPP